MQMFINTSVLAFALTFSAGSFALAHSQQLQSDGTMSQAQPPAAQQPAPQQPAPAQQGPMGMKRAQNPVHETKRLTRELGLTPDQSAKLEPILADRDARMAALHSDATLDPKSMHKQSHAIELETQAKINALLTPAQRQTYADVKAAKHQGQAAPAPAPTN